MMYDKDNYYAIAFSELCKEYKKLLHDTNNDLIKVQSELCDAKAQIDNLKLQLLEKNIEIDKLKLKIKK